MSGIELPDVVTNPKTGRYLLTPATWNGEAKQALYQIVDLMHLMDAMKKVFTFESAIDRPKVVNIEAQGDGTFTIGTDETPMCVDSEGFITPAILSGRRRYYTWDKGEIVINSGEGGQGLVEYALILVMVVIVVIVVMVIFGPALANMYSNIAANL